MRLKATISLYAGGPGSGCNPEVAEPRCGRPSGSGETSPKEASNFLADYHRIFPEAVKNFKQAVGKYGPVEARVKTESSLQEKLSRKNITLDQVRDGMGMRVTTNSMADLYRAVNEVRANYKILEEEDKIKNPTGGVYRAYHFTVEINNKPVEVQVRTQNQSRVAIWMHETVYKGALRGSEVAQQYAKNVAEYAHKLDLGLRVEPPPCPEPLKNDCFSMDLPFTERVI